MKVKKMLLTGGTGKLGQAIISSGYFPSLVAPLREEMDITKPQAVETFFSEQEFDVIIHCAALARMAECESNPFLAIQTNIVGTGNLVIAAMKRKVRFIHISTDGVYAGTRGNYSEADETVPYNAYGWSKLGGECAVRLLSDYCIVRTSFFDPEDIRFEYSPTDKYSSRVTLPYLVKAIAIMAEHPFVGIINIGGERRSDYEVYKEYKSSLKPCSLRDVLKGGSFGLARDASMNCGTWKKIERGILKNNEKG